jgi:hypothetical protein
VGITQQFSTPHGYFIPLNVIQGLPQFFLREPMDKEIDKLLHIVLTSDCDWEPSSLDNDIDPDSSYWYDDDTLTGLYWSVQISSSRFNHSNCKRNYLWNESSKVIE